MKKLLFAAMIAVLFTSCGEETPDVPKTNKDLIEFEGQKMGGVLFADWKMDQTETGAFVDFDGEIYKFKWMRADEAGHENLGAAVYFSADWNQEVKDAAYLEVTTKPAKELKPRNWDLMVYDQYEQADLFELYEEKYMTEGIYDTTNLRADWYFYDVTGAVIGMYRAKEAGFMTEDNYMASIEMVKERLANLGGINTEAYNAYFLLIAMETGEDLGVQPATSVEITADFNGQDLGFAARVYGAEGISNMDNIELHVELLKAALNAEYSLESIDAINGFYSLY